MPVQNPPPGYHAVSPYLTVEAVAELLEFILKVFEGQVVEKLTRADGTVGHCEVRIGDSIVMLGHAVDPSQVRPATLYVYVPDVDATYKRGLEQGAKGEREPVEQYYGDRSGGFIDRWGNHWWIATHVKDVSSEEIARLSKTH
jgi:PhnB protein